MKNLITEYGWKTLKIAIFKGNFENSQSSLKSIFLEMPSVGNVVFSRLLQIS